MSQMSLREYIDTLSREGYTVRDDHGDDPMLITPEGKAVQTWREDYPYDTLMSRNDYEVEKYLLQIELLKFQYWAQDTGHQHVIVFEGRDAAGKGGTIKRFMEHLNPRGARVSRWRSRPIASAACGTSSATSTTCLPQAKWCCSTGPGTTAQA